jgi:hypothetical protein
MSTCTSKSPEQTPPIALRRRGCVTGRVFGLQTGALTLHPRQASGFPTGDPPSVSIGIERPLETVRHISASPISGIRHGFRCHATSATRSADEEQLGVSVGARRIEHLFQTFGKRIIDPRFRRRLPFDSQYTLVKPLKIGKSDEGPLRTSAHIDQYRTGILLQASPNLIHRHIINVDDYH